ncbi:MAG: hypothetical protein U0R19_37610 [Bryobacteraceae bacterium]
MKEGWNYDIRYRVNGELGTADVCVIQKFPKEVRNFRPLNEAEKRAAGLTPPKPAKPRSVDAGELLALSKTGPLTSAEMKIVAGSINAARQE